MLRPLDFAFTERDSPQLRDRVTRDLTLIAQRCALGDERLVALVLTGGFSRGEGTARHDAPVNDYDLVAVRSRWGGAARYRALSDELSSHLGLHVDLLPVSRGHLPGVAAKLFWLDFRLRGRVVWGNEAVMTEMRPIHATDINRREAARLLGNRAAGLLLASAHPKGPTDVELSDLQATKAILAAMDARLLSKNVYAAHLRDRLALSAEEEDHDIFKRAVEWKLGGCSVLLGQPWWDAARRALLNAVQDTHAETATDTWQERAFGLLKAGKLSWNPSSAVRKQAWKLLRDCNETIATNAEWPRVTQSFFAARSKTLQ